MLQERFNEQVPKQGSQEQVAHVPRNSFPRTTWTAKFHKISKNSCKQGWKQEQNPKQGSEGQVPKQGSQAKFEKQVPEQDPNEQV